MNSASPSAAYREAAAWITPTDLSTYLAVTRPWQLVERQDDVREVWSLLGADGRVRARIMLPLATDYADFRDRFSDALAAVGLINDWQPSQLADRLMGIRADLLHIRLGQSHSSETIPLQQADTTISAIYEMITAAADSAVSDTSDDALSGELVRTFLHDQLRFAHTKPGSFVFTVVAQQNRAMARDPSDARTERAVPFSRKVMETLAANLEAACRLTKARELHEQATIAALVPLRRLVQSAELRLVEFSFEWAAVMPAPRVGSAPLQLDLDDLRELRGGLGSDVTVRTPDAPREPRAGKVDVEPEPLPRETLTGFVVELRRRSPSNDDMSGSVLLEGETPVGEYLRVRVILHGNAYRQAIDAHAQGAPLVITGDLVVRPRISRLVGELEINGRYIK